MSTTLMTTAMNTDPLLYSIDEAARLLGVSRVELYRLIQRGEVLSVKVGRLRRVSRAALERYVADLEAHATAVIAERSA